MNGCGLVVRYVCLRFCMVCGISVGSGGFEEGFVISRVCVKKDGS